MKRGVFKHYCGVKRATALGTNGRQTKQTIAVAQRCLFIPMASRSEMDSGFTLGTGFDCYFADPDQDIQMGDQLVWNSRVFNVRAVHRYEVPQVGHVHCLVTREGV